MLMCCGMYTRSWLFCVSMCVCVCVCLRLCVCLCAWWEVSMLWEYNKAQVGVVGIALYVVIYGANRLYGLHLNIYACNHMYVCAGACCTEMQLLVFYYPMASIHACIAACIAAWMIGICNLMPFEVCQHL